MLNKVDRLDPLGRRRLANRFPDALQVSALTGEGLDELRAVWPSSSPTASRTSGCSSPTTRAALSAELYALGAPIDERRDTEAGVLIRAKLPHREVRRFARYLVAGDDLETAATT